MKPDSKVKLISEVDTATGDTDVRRPFKVERRNKRRFIRLEISTPMSLQTLKDTHGGFWPDGNDRVIAGTVLNISAGGVLVDLNEAICCGDIVSMHFILQDIEPLDDVLGLTKRVEQTEEGCLTGIEFLSRERLEDMLSKAEIDLIAGNYTDFDGSVRRVLKQYMYRQPAE
ncbi:MAG: PilZ domain-containing protein [Candidatus Zixiibacteriota bacterium]|nr:MAG: PilZ domain-containing protein [candidate division Zixibacteria bacterium]